MVTTGTNNQILGSALLRMRDKIFVTGHVKTVLIETMKLWTKVEPEPKMNNFGSVTMDIIWI